MFTKHCDSPFVLGGEDRAETAWGHKYILVSYGDPVSGCNSLTYAPFYRTQTRRQKAFLIDSYVVFWCAAGVILCDLPVVYAFCATFDAINILSPIGLDMPRMAHFRTILTPVSSSIPRAIDPRHG